MYSKMLSDDSREYDNNNDKSLSFTAFGDMSFLRDSQTDIKMSEQRLENIKKFEEQIKKNEMNISLEEEKL